VRSTPQGYGLIVIILATTMVLSATLVLESILKLAGVYAQNDLGTTTSNATSKNQNLQNNTEAKTYIVTLKNQSSSADVDDIIKAVEEKGANVTHVYNYSIIGFSVQVPSDKTMDTMHFLLNDTRVNSVEADQTMTLPPPLQ
jgi:peptidase inhibitor I9